MSSAVVAHEIDTVSCESQRVKRMINEHDWVLTQDLHDEALKAGDIGTVVHLHEGSAYEVEFMTLAE